MPFTTPLNTKHPYGNWAKYLDLPKEEIDKLTTRQFHPNELDNLSKLVFIYSKYIQGFPNYLGIHPGGILISEKPIHYYSATYLPPKGFSTAMFDMVVAEDIGLYKFDILSQRGLGKIKEAVDIVKYNHPTHPEIDIHDIKRFKEDAKINEMLKNAKAIGCFYVESPAMRMLLKKLQVDNYLGLVAASSVITSRCFQIGYDARIYFTLSKSRKTKRSTSHFIGNYARNLWSNGLSGRCYQSSALFWWFKFG